MTIYSFLPFGIPLLVFLPFGVPLHPSRSSSPAASFTNPPHPLLFLRTDFVPPCGKIGGADRRIIRYLIVFLIGADYAFCAQSAPADFPQEIPQAGYTLRSQSAPAEIQRVGCALRTLSAPPEIPRVGCCFSACRNSTGRVRSPHLVSPPEIPRAGCCFSACRNSAGRVRSPYHVSVCRISTGRVLFQRMSKFSSSRPSSTARRLSPGWTGPTPAGVPV